MGVNFSRSRESVQHCPREDGNSSSVMEREEEDDFQEAQENPTAAQDLEEFRKQLAIKREQRRSIIAKHTAEKDGLRKSLLTQVQINERIANENKLLRELLELHGVPPPTQEDIIINGDNPLSFLMMDLESIKEHNEKLHMDLAEANLSLQSANEEMINLQGQNVECMKQINALKEVVAVSKTMMQIRESQLNELKAKLAQIESSLADREANLMSSDLRGEYERQLQNIRTLRTLYEERARLAEVSRMQLLRELEDQKVVTAVETTRCKELTDKVAELEVKIVEMSDTIDTKDDQISITKEETRGLKAEMSTVNKLFSQMLLGYKSQQDLDKLVTRLEENHGILSHMVARDGAEASSALPKLLLDLVGQLDHDKTDEQKTQEETTLNTTAEEIVDNLPKVWRVLMELLSHQSVANNENTTEELHPTTCYKPVETSAGTRMVPSVSQTYIRLKDLIVEKLSLTKEMNKMKQLNTHLESRLEEQEKRLCLVTSELSKTWHVVGRLRRHHHQLHTHEKILRYELQQKRKMLNELKEELEYCKEKWDKAREKNTESEIEWHKLRNEFSSRKNKIAISMNSGESGYSDERQTEDDSTESNDESECANDQQIRLKKRLRKAFELLADSSTDRNLAAEREDPISDSLDIADLPLDGLDVDEKDEDLSTSESCMSDSCTKNDTMNENINSQLLPSTSEKTIDETNILLDENIQSKEDLQNNISEIEKKSTAKVDTVMIEKVPMLPGTSSQITCAGAIIKDDLSVPDLQVAVNSQDAVNIINPKAILENVKKQNDRLAKKDERMNRLEEGCSQLLDISKNTLKVGTELEKRLDNITEKRSDKIQDSEKVEIGNNIICEDEKEKDVSQNSTVDGSSSNIIDPKEILENVRKQKQGLTKQDERMKELEEGCDECLYTPKNILQIETQSEARLDIIAEKAENETHCSEDNANLDEALEKSDSILYSENNSSKYLEKEGESISQHPTCSKFSSSENPLSSSNLIDPKVILENEGRLNERLTKRDESVKISEDGCNQLLDISKNTIELGTDIEIRLDNIVERRSDEIQDSEIKESENKFAAGSSTTLPSTDQTLDVKTDSTVCTSNQSEMNAEPSTSIDHEARFAARDERFKRLEELTKSLVSKVNNTTNKSVRLTYKLEELHNIYGSEGSNSINETPDEEESDNEHSSENNDDN